MSKFSAIFQLPLIRLQIGLVISGGVVLWLFFIALIWLYYSPLDPQVVLAAAATTLAVCLVVTVLLAGHTSNVIAAVIHYISAMHNTTDHLTAPKPKLLFSAGPLKDAIDGVFEKMRRNEYALLKNKEMTDAACQQKNEFLAVMSHEIRTPMNGILGTAELLSESGLNARQGSYVGTILRSAEGLLGIVNDILDFSKIESGRLELELIEFDLVELLEDIAELMAPSARQKDLELILSVPADLKRFYIGDPFRLRQVLINLVSNALKFTANGSVIIKVENLGPAQKNSAATILMYVEDTGIGIPAEAQNFIFNKFSQADLSTTRKYGGTGLGLAISQQLVELMNGAMHVASEEGVGSCFAFSLELRLGLRQDTVLRENPELTSKNLLIIDDHPENVKNLAGLLSWQQADVIGRIDSTGLADILVEAAGRGRPFDLILLDYELAAQNGVELAEQITLLLKENAPPIVLLTAMGTELASEAQLLKFGVVGIAQKPTRAQQFCNLIAATLKEGAPSTRVILASGELPTGSRAHQEEVHSAEFKLLTIALPETLLDLIQPIVQQVGCQIESCRDLAAAQPLFRQAKFDRVLIFLTAGNGQENISAESFLAQLTAAEHSVIPVTGLINERESSAKNPIVAAGFNEIIYVSDGAQTFQQAIKNWFPRSHFEVALSLQVPPQYKGVSVLLVEDNMVNQAMMEEILLGMGLKVVTAKNGVFALEEFEKGGIQLILMDCQMPIMDGYKCTQAIRQLELQRELSPVPIVALTAHAISGEQEKCVAAGMDRFLTKPINRRLLYDTLIELLDGQGEPLYCLPCAGDVGIELAGVLNLYAVLPQKAQSCIERYLDDIFSLYIATEKQLGELNIAAATTSIRLINAIANLLGAVQITQVCQELTLFFSQRSGGAHLAAEEFPRRLSELKSAIYQAHQCYEEYLDGTGLSLLQTQQANEAAAQSAVVEADGLVEENRQLPLPSDAGFIFFAQATSTAPVVNNNENEAFDTLATFMAFANTAELIDQEIFNTGRVTLNTRFEEILVGYFTDAAVYGEAISIGIKDHSVACIAQQAHPLKSASRSLGFMRSFLIAREIERFAVVDNAQRCDFSVIEILLVALDNSISATRQQLYLHAKRASGWQ